MKQGLVKCSELARGREAIYFGSFLTTRTAMVIAAMAITIKKIIVELIIINIITRVRQSVILRLDRRIHIVINI